MAQSTTQEGRDSPPPAPLRPGFSAEPAATEPKRKAEESLQPSKTKRQGKDASPGPSGGGGVPAVAPLPVEKKAEGQVKGESGNGGPELSGGAGSGAVATLLAENGGNASEGEQPILTVKQVSSL